MRRSTKPKQLIARRTRLYSHLWFVAPSGIPRCRPPRGRRRSWQAPRWRWEWCCSRSRAAGYQYRLQCVWYGKSPSRTYILCCSQRSWKHNLPGLTQPEAAGYQHEYRLYDAKTLYVRLATLLYSIQTRRTIDTACTTMWSLRGSCWRCGPSDLHRLRKRHICMMPATSDSTIITTVAPAIGPTWLWSFQTVKGGRERASMNGDSRVAGVPRGRL